MCALHKKASLGGLGLGLSLALISGRLKPSLRRSKTLELIFPWLVAFIIILYCFWFSSLMSRLQKIDWNLYLKATFVSMSMITCASASFTAFWSSGSTCWTVSTGTSLGASTMASSGWTSLGASTMASSGWISLGASTMASFGWTSLVASTMASTGWTFGASTMASTGWTSLVASSTIAWPSCGASARGWSSGFSNSCSNFGGLFFVCGVATSSLLKATKRSRIEPPCPAATFSTFNSLVFERPWHNFTKSAVKSFSIWYLDPQAHCKWIDILPTVPEAMNCELLTTYKYGIQCSVFIN